jgi:peptidoglycan lytic transglycosylase B
LEPSPYSYPRRKDPKTVDQHLRQPSRTEIIGARAMRRFVAAILLGFALVVPSVVRATGGNGWDYLIDKLTTDGVNPDVATAVFDDPRMPPFTGLEFSPAHPRESYAGYRHFLKASSVAQARSCRLRYASALESAERHTRVPASILAAILYVETGCGRNTGSYMILYRLARLAMANEPDNFRRNLGRFAGRDGTIDADTQAQLRARARYLEETFYPEVRATFIIAERQGIDPLALRGSPSGAFGYPQFLPSSFLRHGADGDGDGEVSLYNPADAAVSAARYLVAYGWRPDLSRSERRQVIWHYNHSDAYIDTVLTLAARIEAPSSGTFQVASNKKKAAPHTSQKKATARRTTTKRRGG